MVLLVTEVIGIAPIREEERGLAVNRLLEYALSLFEHHESVLNGVVLFCIPELISQELTSFSKLLSFLNLAFKSGTISC